MESRKAEVTHYAMLCPRRRLFFFSFCREDPQHFDAKYAPSTTCHPYWQTPQHYREWHTNVSALKLGFWFSHRVLGPLRTKLSRSLVHITRSLLPFSRKTLHITRSLLPFSRKTFTRQQGLNKQNLWHRKRFKRNFSFIRKYIWFLEYRMKTTTEFLLINLNCLKRKRNIKAKI